MFGLLDVPPKSKRNTQDVPQEPSPRAPPTPPVDPS
jgi:hypothetical protein